MAESIRSSTDMSPGGQEGSDTWHGFRFNKGRAPKELPCNVPDLLQGRADVSQGMILSFGLLYTGSSGTSPWVKKMLF